MHARSNNLTKMANQISAFFSSQSETDPEVSAKAVAAHLKLFWAPSMRADLVAQFDRGEADDVSQVVAKALRDHRASLLDTGLQTSAERREIFPQGGGDAG